ncbi:MAG: GNAT family N-acetyltransferase [Phycisphaeraceae bacterium]|nr:MAG: GNAT family N-acetyltransferase [Phycisphaeraceae bacterium]
MQPLFPTDVARLEEPRMVADLAAVADHAEPILGGVMARSDPGSWTNHAIGLCLDAPADDASLDRLVRYYTDHGIEPRVELCPFAHESLAKGLGARGFIFKSFEFVFARDLDAHTRIEPPHPAPEGLTINPIDAADEAALREYATTIYRTFFPPEHPGPTDNDVTTMLRYIRSAGTTAFAAMFGAELVGGGSVTVHGPVATITAAGVKEAHRRQGVQQHLLAARLRLAAESGAQIATVGSRPGAATERNVVRMGFNHAYSRAILVMPGEGLVGEPG